MSAFVEGSKAVMPSGLNPSSLEAIYDSPPCVHFGAGAQKPPRKLKAPTRKIRDLSGQKFGQLTVICLLGINRKRLAVFRCACECGGQIDLRSDALTGGRRRSCGCLSKQRRFQPGERRSQATEFAPGSLPRNYLPVDSITHRTDKFGVVRAWIKIAEPNKWRQLAVHVWEKENGPLPRGCVIHHKDRNPLNDALENLECLTRSEHIEEHRHEFDPIGHSKRRAVPYAERKAAAKGGM